MNVSELIILLASDLNEGKIKPDAKVCVSFYSKQRDKTETYIAQDVESVKEDNTTFILSF